MTLLNMVVVCMVFFDELTVVIVLRKVLLDCRILGGIDFGGGGL